MERNSPISRIQPWRKGDPVTAARLSQLGTAINRINAGNQPPSQIMPTIQGGTDTISLLVDGGGSAITSAGLDGAIAVVTQDCTITGWVVSADQSGSIEFDVTRENNGVPSTSIVGGTNNPALSSAQYASGDPTGWTSVDLVAGDVIGFAIIGTPATVQRVTLALEVQF